MQSIRFTYVAKYGQGWDAAAREAVEAGYVRLGMTAEQVLAAWGQPRDRNRTTSSHGTSEQWVYRSVNRPGAQYVYLENGVVTTLQD